MDLSRRGLFAVLAVGALAKSTPKAAIPISQPPMVTNCTFINNGIDINVVANELVKKLSAHGIRLTRD